MRGAGPARWEGRLFAACGLAAALALSGSAAAHVVVSAALVQDILHRVTRLKQQAAAEMPADARAKVLLDLGETLTRATQLLNQDLAAHGSPPSLASQALVAQLRARGFPLRYSAALTRYRAPLELFEAALKLAPDSPRAADARFRILASRFYESFAADPYELVGMDWRGLLDQIDEARAFLARYPKHRARDEVTFMLAVDYARAARLAPDAKARRAFREDAIRALSAYVHTHPPDDMRASTAKFLLEDITAKR